MLINFPTHDRNHTLDLVITSSDTSLAPSLFSSHFSPSDHFPFSQKFLSSQLLFLPNTLFFSPTSFHRHWLFSWRSKIFSSYNQPSRISWLSLGCLQLHSFIPPWPTAHLLSQNCLNANPNLILSSLLLSEPSDQPFVVLKTSRNAHTLLYIGLLSNLFVTNTIDWSSLPRSSISPTWSLTIQSVCGKLLTMYFIANILHHYLHLPQALLSLTASLTASQTKFPNFISLSSNTSTSPHTHPPLQLNLPVFLLLGLHLSRKYLRFFSTVLTSSLTLIRSPPDFWKYVLLFLHLPLPTLSICLYPQVSSILFSKNLLSRLFSRNLL